jgi:hypothetical protein
LVARGPALELEVRLLGFEALADGLDSPPV